MPARGCGGSRVAGGIYLTVGTSPNGRPVEFFLVDPPQIITPAAVGLTPVGVRGIQDSDGTYHVMDWVGSEHYPYVTDFIEEARRHGISRRAEGSGLDYSRLTLRSTLILVHSRAAFAHPEYVSSGLSDAGYRWRCPKHPTHPGEGMLAETCLGMHYHVFPERDVRKIAIAAAARDMPPKAPEWSYDAWIAPETITAHESGRTHYRPSIFARFPIGGIDVVRDRRDKTRETAQIAKAQASALPFSLKEE